MKGKYDIKYHCQLLAYINEQAKESKQKVEVVLNLISSLFETSKTSNTGFLTREAWLITYNQLENLVVLIDEPKFKEQLKAYLQKEKGVEIE